MEKLIAEMESVLKEIEALEARRETEKDSDKQKILQDEIDAKTKSWEGVKSQVAKAKERESREKYLADVRGERDQVASKRGQLTDVRETNSEHNETAALRERDKASAQYMMQGKRGLLAYAKDSENIIDAVRAKKAEDGFVLPSYVRDHILTNRFVGKTEYHVLTSDASGSQSGGGSLVSDTFIPELYKVPQTVDRLMDRCWVKRAITGSAKFPKLTQSATEPFGITVTWDSEGAGATEHDPVFSQVSVATNRLACVSYVSEKELRVNAVGLEAEIASMFRGAMSRAISTAIISGTGSNQPMGVNSASGITGGCNIIARQTTDQVSYTDLVNLQFGVDEGVMDDGVFVIGKGANSALKYIAALDDSNGRPVLRNYQTWGDGLKAVPMLAGSEYIATPANTATLGNRGDVIFGAFRNYGLAIDQDITIARSDDYAFNAALVTFRVIAYIGGQPLGFDCFAMLGDASGESSSSST